MSDDPAVRAVAGSVTFQTELQSLEDDTFGSEDTYGLNPGFRPFDEHVEAIARAAVEAARPIIEAEARLEAAVVAREAAAAEAEAYRRGCDDTAAELIALSRAAVRMEPEK